MSLIDSHCHLYYDQYLNNMDSTINECKKCGVDKLLSISVDFKTSLTNIELANKYNEIYCSIGIHPNNVIEANVHSFEKYKNIINKSKKILAIGEIGLDYFRNTNKEQQKFFFEKQIELALDINLPIIIHSRDAEEDTIKILKKYSKNLKFLVHCFTGSKKFANEILDINGFISFSGIITFKNSIDLQEICKLIPLENLLVETDSPYLSPEPFRGKQNHPKNLNIIAKKLAQIKNIEFNDLASKTTNNFRRLFLL